MFKQVLLRVGWVFFCALVGQVLGFITLRFLSESAQILIDYLINLAWQGVALLFGFVLLLAFAQRIFLVTKNRPLPKANFSFETYWNLIGNWTLMFFAVTIGSYLAALSR